MHLVNKPRFETVYPSNEMNFLQISMAHQAQGLSNYRVLSIIFKNRRMKKKFFSLF